MKRWIFNDIKLHGGPFYIMSLFFEYSATWTMLATTVWNFQCWASFHSTPFPTQGTAQHEVQAWWESTLKTYSYLKVIREKNVIFLDATFAKYAHRNMHLNGVFGCIFSKIKSCAGISITVVLGKTLYHSHQIIADKTGDRQR